MLISEFNGYELISLIGLRLRVGDCEVMDRARSCGEMVLVSISGVNEKDPIYWIGRTLIMEHVLSPLKLRDGHQIVSLQAS